MAEKRQQSQEKAKPGKQDLEFLDAQKHTRTKATRLAIIKFNWYQALCLVLMMIVAFIIYSNTFHTPFVFDGTRAIEENHFIRVTELSWRNIINAATGYGKNRPVSNLTFAFNYYFGRYKVVGYHLVNILIHIANGILLYSFLKITFSVYHRKRYDGSKLNSFTVTSISFCTALLWLAHPIQTQSVTYIVQRMNSMGAMFFMLSLLLYAKGRLSQQRFSQISDNQAINNREKRNSIFGYVWFSGCALAGILAFGSKESTVSLPFFILLYEWYFFQDFNLNWLKKSLKYISAVVILLGLVAFIFLGSEPLEKLKALRDFSEGQFTLGQRLLTQTRVVIHYLSLIICPHPSRLNLDYDFPLSYSLMNPITTLFSLTAIIGLLFLGLYLAKRERLISFCIFWFFGNLVIESSVIPLALIFEHRLYLPSMMLFLIPVTLGDRYIKLTWIRAGLVCLAVVVLSVWTYQRNAVWENTLTLWTDVVKKSPNKARPHLNLGESLSELERFDESLDHYLAAIRIKPDYTKAYINVGNAMQRQERTDEAINYYREAIRLGPSFAAVHNNLGNILAKQNKIQEAIYHYTEALRLEPDSAGTHYNLAIALDSQGNIPEAVHHYTEALRLNPAFADAHYDLGVAFQKQARLDEAISHFKQALKIQPDLNRALNHLALTYAAARQYENALAAFKKIADLQPDNASHSYNIACMYALQNNTKESIGWLKKAVAQGYQNWEIIKTDKDLENIRNSEEYRQLIKDH